jgi:Putative Zn-dependent protease, contains TPR repeats
MNRRKLQNTLDAALASHRAGQIEEAARLYAQVCHAAPRLFDGWYLAGALAFQRGGHLEEAIDYLTRALRLQPASVDCKLFLGMALADAGRYEEAEKPLRAALAKHKGFPEAWENLANVLCALGRPAAEAIECLRRSLALEPGRIELQQRIDELLMAETMSASV